MIYTCQIHFNNINLAFFIRTGYEPDKDEIWSNAGE